MAKDKELTLEEAEKLKEQIIQRIEILRHRGSDSDLLLARHIEKTELEALTGSVEYEPKRDEDGNIIKTPYVIQRGALKGQTVLAIEYDENTIRKRIPGLIQILSSEAQKAKEVSNLGLKFDSRTFENFDYRHNKKAFEDARAYADYEDLFGITQNCRLIFGNIGTGKTHLAAAIANRLYERSIPVLFGTWESHLQRLREEIENTSIKTYLEKMKTVSVLVIDDIGREKRSEWTMATLYSVINYRYEHMLPTVITTNLNDDQFFTWVGGDVASRLVEMCYAIRTGGEDYRNIIKEKYGENQFER